MFEPIYYRLCVCVCVCVCVLRIPGIIPWTSAWECGTVDWWLLPVVNWVVVTSTAVGRAGEDQYSMALASNRMLLRAAWRLLVCANVSILSYMLYMTRCPLRDSGNGVGWITGMIVRESSSPLMVPRERGVLGQVDGSRDAGEGRGLDG